MEKFLQQLKNCSSDKLNLLHFRPHFLFKIQHRFVRFDFREIRQTLQGGTGFVPHCKLTTLRGIFLATNLLLFLVKICLFNGSILHVFGACAAEVSLFVYVIHPCVLRRRNKVASLTHDKLLLKYRIFFATC